ncbi:hypothetical protein TeGR_g13809 [Tetraparma gracilis]|uniref:Peptidase C1A papain C-terminal domain-containing protein n=1 Tax=Tetraparma gracilis TaxID=2962635 RepID=A0ABQ6MC06_9STRA|nr:hypothetical protein TeGR_g13809 [Tetraparma gracilis]
MRATLSLTLIPAIAASATLPASVDWSAIGAVSAVGDEGSCGGGCWAFAASGAVEGALYAKTKNMTPLSTQQLVNCVYTNHDSCASGGTMEDAFNYIRDNGGLCSAEDWQFIPENRAAGTCSVDCNTVSGSAISGYRKVAGSEDALMEAVARQPVAVAVQGLTGPFAAYKGGVLTGQCGTALDHGLLLVGYGETEDGVKYWKLKNDFGEDWGEAGYVKIERNGGQNGNKGMCGILMDATYPLI